MLTFDVLVVGAGHAGCEAAAASARLGARTLLLTHKIETVGEMSCNPAIGGLGKGQLVREIDALDGVMGHVADAAAIHYRVLNRSKGPAVQGLRAQADRKLYRQAMLAALQKQDNLTIKAGAADDLIVSEKGELQGVVTEEGEKIFSPTVILATGTFLRGITHQGTMQTRAGRFGDPASYGLSDALERVGFTLERLKTGTPSRLDGKTIDWAAVEKQLTDEKPEFFSMRTTDVINPQIACGITHTSLQTLDIIRKSIPRAPLYSGQIKGRGPRYCPSIEDKVVRFADKERHQIFLEPEGLDDDTVYPNGISTSLPVDVQDEFIHSIKGLERVRVIQFGYAIEYDYIDPRECLPTMETKKLPGLFLAGQINGTTGYEEAAALGLMAGLNAALKVQGKEPFLLNRAQAYIGVMIDDLITRGVTEPYRMFTSRAEYRLTLRADNADQRLTPLGVALGCVGEDRQRFFDEKMMALTKARSLMTGLKASPNKLAKAGISVNEDGVVRSALELLAYPAITLNKLAALWPELGNLSVFIAEQLEIDGKYAGYIERQERDIKAFLKDEKLVLPKNIDIDAIGSLSTEMKQKFIQVGPRTIGAAARIPGVTPAAVVALLRYVRHENKAQKTSKDKNGGA